MLTDFNKNSKNTNHHSNEDDDDDDDDEEDDDEYYEDDEYYDDKDNPQIKAVSSTLANSLELVDKNNNTINTDADDDIFMAFSSYVNKNMSEKKMRAQFNKDYVLGARIGEGGFGIIFSATRCKDNRPVAVKVIRKSKVNQWYDFKPNR